MKLLDKDFSVDTAASFPSQQESGREGSKRIMKKALRVSPNARLKAERELRGWSQKYVADQIGADHYYLSRWERGSTAPSPFYRQKLCDLFGKNAKELGLLPADSPVSDEEDATMAQGEPSLASASPVRVIYDPAIPLLMAEGTGLVGRDELLRQLKERLYRGHGVALTALNGLPGVGKTSLAVALAQDADIQEFFSDGVLWTGLGPAPNILSLLSRWGTLLGLRATEVSQLSNIEEWSRALRIAIGTRRLLLVIDDAWRIEAALAFKVGGPHCAYLVTTRFPQIALHFAPNDATVVRELSEDDGLTLLGRLAPDLAGREPQTARTLVRVVGGLPLALTIMGNYLRTQGHGGQPRRIRAALARLIDAQERLRLTESHALLERSPSLPQDAPVSLQTVIAVGDEQLDEQTRGALRALSVFPPKPNSFSEEAATTVCAVPVETLDILSDAGLLESSEPGRYTLHQTIADYAQAHLTDTEASARMVAYFAHYVEVHKKDYEALEQESSNIFAALEAASQEGRHSDLVRCINAFAWFLQARGLYAQANDYLTQTEQITRTVEDNAGLAMALLHLGRIRFNHGDYDQSGATLKEGLAFARTKEDDAPICQFLLWLGTIARYRGDYRQAHAYHQEGLAIARQLGDLVQTSALLMGLGTDAWEEGNYTQAEAYLHEGMTLARQAGDRERLCETLVNCGTVAYVRGNYALGDSYSVEALTIARQIGYRQAVTVLLTNLGEIAAERENYVQAEVYLEEALVIARQVENRELISASLMMLARVAMEKRKYVEAGDYLQEALMIARQIGRHRLLCEVLNACGELQLKQQQWIEASTMFGEVRNMATEVNQEFLAIALFGLARVAAAKGDMGEARGLGQESLRISAAIENRLTGQVKAWLDELPKEE